MSNKDIILVGQFGSPLGLKGEIKVNMMTTSFEVFKNLKNYYNFDGSVAWNFKNMPEANELVDLAVRLEWDTWNNKKTSRVILVDWKKSIL